MGPLIAYQTADIPSPHALGVDGVDHINVHNRWAKTRLGALLSNYTVLSFNHPVLGPFQTVEGLWQYIRSPNRDDRFRGALTSQLRQSIRPEDIVSVPNFTAIVMDAIYQKIIQNEELHTLFLASELPFSHYWLNRNEAAGTDVRISIPGLNFIIIGLHHLRRNLQSGGTPPAPDYALSFPDLVIRP